jgi:hypothetical protein
MSNLTDSQIMRQDYVDNAIFHLLQEVNPTSTEISWDIEMIGDVRDSIKQWLVEKRQICDEMCFYPYIKE